ncbi:hypothetical protein PAMP_011916 [Pampus punctatissimus]
MEEEGEKKEEDEGGWVVAPMRTQRNEEREREKSSNTSRVPLSLCSSIVQAECPPTSYTPTRSSTTTALLLQRSIPPSPLFYQLSDLCSAPLLAPPFHRSTEKWRKDETLQRGKKINNTDG